MNRLLVITGTQRSGTSFMASFFKNCSFDLGTEFWDDRINGGLESPDICNHFAIVFDDRDFPFKGYWDMIERRQFHSFSKLHNHLKVVKFSYLLSNPEFLRHWIDVRGNGDHFLIMKRPLRDVVKSKKSKPEFAKEDSKLLPTTFKTLQRNWIESLKIIEQSGIKHFTMNFPPDQPANDYVARIRKNSPWPLPHYAEEKFKEIYNPDKIQFK